MGTKRYHYSFIQVLLFNLVVCNGQFGIGNNPYLSSNHFNLPNNNLNSNQKGLTNYVSSPSNTAADSNTLQYTNNCEGNTIENTHQADGKITLKNLRFLNGNERVLTNPSQVSEVAALSNPGTASSLASYFVNNRLANSAFNNFGQNAFRTNFLNEEPSSTQQMNNANMSPPSNQGFAENQAMQYPTNNPNNQGILQRQLGTIQPSSYFHQNPAAVQPQQSQAQQNIAEINSQSLPIDYNQHNIGCNQQGNPAIQLESGGEPNLGPIQYGYQTIPTNNLNSLQQQIGLQTYNQVANPQTLGVEINQQPPMSNYNQPAPTQQKNAFVVQQQAPPQSNFYSQQGSVQPALTFSNPSTVFQAQPPNTIFPNNQGQLQQQQNHQAVQAQPTVRYLPASILKAIEELKPNQGNVPVIVLDAPVQNPSILQETHSNQQTQALAQQQPSQANQNQPIIILQTQEPLSSQSILSQPQQQIKQNQPFIILQTQQPSSVPQKPNYNFVDSTGFSQPIQQNTQQVQPQPGMLPLQQQFPQYDYTPSPGLPPTHQPSKSSNLKVLLPLLMNLLKDRNNDSYRQCNNCGNNCGCYRAPEPYMGEYNKHNDYSDETNGIERKETKSKYSKSKEMSEEIIEKESEERVDENEED